MTAKNTLETLLLLMYTNLKDLQIFKQNYKHVWNIEEMPRKFSPYARAAIVNISA